VEIYLKTWGNLWDLLGLRLAQLLGITGGSKVLDVGTGGGSTLIAALKCIGPTGYVVSLDKEQIWVDHVNSELARLNIVNAEVRHMDAKEIDMPDGVFDFAISGFLGWGHCFDFANLSYRSQDLVMKEIHRTLRVGGRTGISTWLFQEDTEWMERFVQSYDYAARRLYSKESEEGWKLIMEHSPFKDSMLLPETFEYTYESLDVWWNEMLQYGWQKQLEEVSKQKDLSLDEIKLKAIEKLGEHLSDSGVSFTRRVLFILATKQD